MSRFIKYRLTAVALFALSTVAIIGVACGGGADSSSDLKTNGVSESLTADTQLAVAQMSRVLLAHQAGHQQHRLPPIRHRLRTWPQLKPLHSRTVS
jgi:hypothetical protein